MTTYSNPRMQATIHDWPSGSRRVTARFWIEIDRKRGERACRETTGKPVKLTYATHQRIVDGDDGRTYIVSYSPAWGHVTVFSGDMKFARETAHASEPRYAELVALATA